ncbi:MAG: hypothetical protein JSV78_14565 [Phycisphaerales bacterium]|nr:MAG: hypothetical protein JSV78_14565 [Phycisphaerales bacterium]
MNAEASTRLVSILGALSALCLVGLSGTLGQEKDASKEPSQEHLAVLVAELQGEVEALRGWKFKHPVAVERYTEEGLRAFIRGDDSEGESGWGKKARSAAAMRIVGLLPEGCDPDKMFEEVMTEFVPGIYDHEKDILGVVTREGAEYDSLHFRSVLIHELTHALDDQYFDFERLMSQHASSDAQFALSAVIEGSAVTLQERFERKARASGKYDMAAAARAKMEEMSKMQSLFQAPPYVRSFMARFPSGIRFLQRGDMTGFMAPDGPTCVADAVKAALQKPPLSSEQILHPEKYWQESQREEPAIVDEEQIEKLVETVGLQVEFTDTYGELLCAIVTAPADSPFNPMAMMMPNGWTNDAAMGWAGDRFFLMADDAGESNASEKPNRLCGLWLTLWDTPQDREEFVTAYEAHRPMPSRSVLRLKNNTAVFFFGLSAVQQDGLQEGFRVLHEP